LTAGPFVCSDATCATDGRRVQRRSRVGRAIGSPRARYSGAVGTLANAASVEPHLAGGGTGDPNDVTPHTLRHSVAYRIIQVNGRRLEDVQLRLRHANRQTTDQIYIHLVPR
jgi:integrase